MKLFISYSRDDRAWVYELWRHLRDILHHDVWIDKRIVPASDWWHSILQQIEVCECFIYIITPKSVESIYCDAELHYAIALNKPILPLMLKPATYPEILNKKRVQFQTINDDLNIDKVLLGIVTGLMELNQHNYPPQQASRPDVPMPKQNPDQLIEVFTNAEEALSAHNFNLAQQLFEQVIKVDPNGLGVAAKERLEATQFEQKRSQDYRNVKRLAENPITLKGAQAAWRNFKNYYSDYDPDNLAQVLELSRSEVQTPSDWATIHNSRISKAVKKPTAKELLPAPFDWCEIPEGTVTIEKGGYLEEKTTFYVPAFLIAKYPITNAQYRVFVNDMGYENEDWWKNGNWGAKQEGWGYEDRWKASHVAWTEPLYWKDTKFNGDKQPIVGVSWYESIAFCMWLQEKTGEKIVLPSELQWQRAAQARPDGADSGLKYLWGREWVGGRCNNQVRPENSAGTTPVTAYESKGNISPCGVVDLIGNVWEWCLTDMKTGANTLYGDNIRIIRGGSWNVFNSLFMRSSYRTNFHPYIRNYSLGIRCALPLS